jgi:hypothetical protein
VLTVAGWVTPPRGGVIEVADGPRRSPRLPAAFAVAAEHPPQVGVDAPGVVGALHLKAVSDTSLLWFGFGFG